MDIKLERNFSTAETLIKENNIHRYNFSKIARFPHLWRLNYLIMDICSLLIASVLTYGFQTLISGDTIFFFSHIIVLVIVAILAYRINDLYSQIYNPVDGLRKFTVSTSFVFLTLFITSYLSLTKWSSLQEFLVLTWFLSLILLPFGRLISSRISSRIKIFGEPVLVIGNGPLTRQVVKYLLNDNLKIGLRLVALLDGSSMDYSKNQKSFLVSRMDKPDKFHELNRHLNVSTCVLIASEAHPDLMTAILKNKIGDFRQVIFVNEMDDLCKAISNYSSVGFWIDPEEKFGWYDGWTIALKRCMDVTFTLLGGILIFPVIVTIWVLIKIDSGGNVFYGDLRIGEGGRKFKAWKFRTMVPNANQVLKIYLEKNPEVRKEWEATRKLKNDPRVTRIGKILRQLSLDELPQLWNVLIGDMSLVGPRPVPVSEVNFYGDDLDLYVLVKPGITGLWQVSGRNDTSYKQRVNLNSYYIQCWSIWLDIYILARTVKAVIGSQGAY